MIASVIIYSCLAGLATLAGIALLRLSGDSALRYSHYLNSTAAGFILAVAFFHLMPEAVELIDSAMLFTMLGFVAFYLLEAVLVVLNVRRGRVTGRSTEQLVPLTQSAFVRR